MSEQPTKVRVEEWNDIAQITVAEFVEQGYAALIAKKQCKVVMSLFADSWVEAISKSNEGYWIRRYDAFGANNDYFEGDEPLTVYWFTPASEPAAVDGAELLTTVDTAEVAKMKAVIVNLERQLADVQEENELHVQEWAARTLGDVREGQFLDDLLKERDALRRQLAAMRDDKTDGRFVTETLNLATACLNSEQTTPQPSPSPAVNSELLAAVKPFVALWEKWLSVDLDTDEDSQEYINLFQWLDDEIAADKFAEMMLFLAKAAALKAGESG